MIAISLPSTRGSWSTMSFTSTLYLHPVLELLLAKVPSQLQPEIQLGLQEALVNAAKHGNKLDPSKTIVVQFLVNREGYYWIISDEGCGFSPDSDCKCKPTELLPSDDEENGRGLCLLHHIFDRVQWDKDGTQLTLCKRLE
ncbi:MAG: anti-sigma regulatory factor [Hydrococcus sp. RM1_1_31]|nr:anti-sigma regulatory factor [Hydrococcus sp. RM1_1_31]